jgi:O-antigen biosynthesis protein
MTSQPLPGPPRLPRAEGMRVPIPVPAKVLDVELSRPVPDHPDLQGYRLARILVRVHGAPVGFLDAPVRDGTLTPEAIAAVLPAQLGKELGSHLGGDVATVSGGSLREGTLLAVLPPAPESRHEPWPSLTVAVCTRDRPEDLAGCVESLLALDYPGVEMLVIDNAPTGGGTADVCRAHPQVRRVVEPRPGLDWARNRAVLEARGEILAFTDDDVRVDPDWARAVVRPFVGDPGVMAVAGLVVPLELETRAQEVFERYGGLSGGMRSMRMQGGPEWGERGLWHYAWMALQGSGANMAFRRSVFSRTGLFDPGLDVGTPTNGGGDTEMFFRVMACGFGMVYEPRAIVRHRHRREHDALRRQISGWGTGVSAFLVQSLLAFPRAWWVLVLFGLRGFGSQLARLARPSGVPRALVLTELAGWLVGPVRLLKARSLAKAVEKSFGPQVQEVST